MQSQALIHPYFNPTMGKKGQCPAGPAQHGSQGFVPTTHHPPLSVLAPKLNLPQPLFGPLQSVFNHAVGLAQDLN